MYDVFQRLASLAASRLLGASAERRWSNVQLAKQLEKMVLDDPELAAHYQRLAKAVTALQAVRRSEDAA